MKYLFLLSFLFSSWLHATLPVEVRQLLNQSGLPEQDVSIYIKELGSNRVIASHYAESIREPASVVKVMTTYAALLTFGFEYRWPTEFYATGMIRNGTLHGDLVIKGYGDPTLSNDHISAIVREIRNQGIRKITGHIIMDRSYFSVGDAESSHFDIYTYSAYNAMPDAIMFNERTSTVCITPQSRSAHKEVKDPAYSVVNRIKFVNRSCKGKYAWVKSNVDRSKRRPELVLKGELSRHCREKKVCKIVTKPYKSLYYALKSGLEKEGVSVDGSLHLGDLPRHSKHLFTHYSKPLEAIVSKTAKKSNNLYARHLLLHIGAQMYGAPATVSKGRKAIMRLLEKEGALNGQKFYMENGSGLSRVAKMSAKQLSLLYESAYERFGKRWMNTLSIAGRDGTIKKRFKEKPAQERAWMKTGTLKHVKNIGGYVQNAGGNYYTVAVLVNTIQKRHYGAKLQNDIINWLAGTTKKGSSAQRVLSEDVLDLW